MAARPLSEAKVLKIINMCAVDKATGWDGFTIGFLKVCWGFLKEDIMSIVQNFHQNKIFDKSFNATSIALIPKRNGVEVKRF